MAETVQELVARLQAEWWAAQVEAARQRRLARVGTRSSLIPDDPNAEADRLEIAYERDRDALGSYN